MVERKLVKLRFLGGPKAPGGYGKNKPLIIGDIYELTERHALFSWFERVDKKAAPAKPPTATDKESVFEKKEKDDQSKEFQDAFKRQIVSDVGQIPIDFEKKKAEKPVAPDAGAGADVVSAEVLRKKYERLTKKELVIFIQEKGGSADEGMLKAMLIEIAISKSS